MSKRRLEKFRETDFSYLKENEGERVSEIRKLIQHWENPRGVDQQRERVVLPCEVGGMELNSRHMGANR